MYNIMLIGGSEVGKTAIARRYAHDDYPVLHKKTIGVDFTSSSKTGVRIWDMAGDERYFVPSPKLTEQIQSILLVFDITNRDSFENLDKWRRKIQDSLTHDIPFILVGNKCDREDDREVTYDEARKYAKDNDFALYIETSAWKGTNINELFEKTIGQIKNPAETEFSLDEGDDESEDSTLGKEEKLEEKIRSYAECLTKLKKHTPSLNHNGAGLTKGNQLQEIFHGEGPTQQQLEDILRGNQYPKLLDNRSRLPFKLYKLKSLVTGCRNEFSGNRLCESKSEEMLVKYHDLAF